MAIVVVVLVGASLYALLCVAERSPRFCLMCHSMENAHHRYLMDVHSREGVVCIDCHGGMGVVGKVKEMLSNARNLWVELFGKYDEKRARTRARELFTDEVCLKCHSGEDLEKKGAEYHHIRWKGRKPKCVECHSDVGHARGEVRESESGAGKKD